MPVYPPCSVSSQDGDYQQELVNRLRLPFEMLSDPELELADMLGLPTFRAAGATLYKRLTLIVHDAVIEHVCYPVFPPNEHAQQILSWLRAHPVPGRLSSGPAGVSPSSRSRLGASPT